MIAIWGQGKRSTGIPVTADLAAWFRFNSGITDSAGAVSQWDDASGNARHLKQATATNQPAKQGDGSILFDGVDNYLKCDAFTLIQPETIYLLGKQVGYTAIDTVMDGNTVNTLRLFQSGASPAVVLNAGSGDVASNSNWTLNTYATVAVVLNGASSLIQVNATTATTGNPGAGNMGGFTLGAGGNSTAFANIQVKEVAIYSVAHDEATRAQVIAYMNAL